MFAPGVVLVRVSTNHEESAQMVMNNDVVFDDTATLRLEPNDKCSRVVQDIITLYSKHARNNLLQD